MEWTVNQVLREPITKLDYTLVPPGFRGDVRSLRSVQDWLVRVIDALGEQSTAAQGLNKVITSADKLRHSPDHTLYLLKDANAKNGAGEVVGMLKMGRKHLFLWDESGTVQEAEPLCVLDFFVLKGRQRAGLGTMLFNHMLEDMNTTVDRLAIDGPSGKMESFLARNYKVTRLLRQANNFAVASNFFANSHGKPERMEFRSTQLVGRFAAPKPASAIGSVIHGTENTAYDFANGNSRPASPEPPAVEAGPAVEAAVDPTPAPSREPTPPPAPVRPATLSVGTPASGAASPARRDTQLTDRGYFDVKFYHSKLW